jgi:hypothetical protein
MIQEISAAGELPHRPWWRRTWPWGLAASLLFGMIPLFTASHGVAILLAFLVVLTGTTITLLIEPLVRFDDLIENISSAVSTLKTTVATLDVPPSLQQYMRDVADDWRAIESTGAEYLQGLLRTSSQESAARIHSLAQGKIEVGLTDRNNFRSAPLTQFRSLKGVHAVNLGYWNTQHGKHYLERQQTAIQAGTLTVQRIMIVTPEDVKRPDVQRGVRRQLDAGVQVFIVYKDGMPKVRHAEEDFTIATDRHGIQMLVKPADSDTESFSCDRGQIDDYENTFEQLRNFSHSGEEIFPPAH